MEPQQTFDLVWISGVVGAFLPLAISAIKRSTWNEQTKRALSVALAAIAGVVTVGVQQGLALDENFFQSIIISILDVYTVSSVTYHNFWKDTAIERGLESLGSNDLH